MASSPKWEGLSERVVETIDKACARVEMAQPADIAERLKQLNDTLRAEGTIGLPMQVKTGLPMFIRKELSDNGVEEHPIFEAELIRQREFEGIFRGVIAHPVQSEDDMTILFYDVELSEKDNLHLEAAVDASQVRVEYADQDNWEEEVHAAFAILETVDDPEYAELVEQLRREFWNNSGDLLTRMRNIGFHTISLLASDQHKKEAGDLNDALELILASSIDQDALYEVSGIDMLETVNNKGEDVIYLKHMSRPHIVKPIEIQYLTYFEVLGFDGERIDVQLYNAIQPVYIFLDPRTREEIAIPLRFFASIKESEFDEASLPPMTSHVVSNDRNGSNPNGMSCGELSRDYERRQRDSEV